MYLFGAQKLEFIIYFHEESFLYLIVLEFGYVVFPVSLAWLVVSLNSALT